MILESQRFSQHRSSFTVEQENFTRFGKAIVGIGSNVLQELLEGYIPSKDIACRLTSTSHPNLWRKLNPEQKNLIGNAATDGYKDFDITLCYTLLRNLNVSAYISFKPPFPSPTRGWGKPPKPTDITQSDDIERIRILRNEMYGHLAQPAISTVQFTDIWRQLKDVFTRMKTNYPNGTDFLKELSNLESCTVTRVQWNNIVELAQKCIEHEKAIEDQNRRFMKMEVQQNTIDQSLQTASAQITTIENKVDSHDVHLAALDTEVSGHVTQLDELTRQLGEVDIGVGRHEAQMEEHTRLLRTLNKEVHRHDSQVEEHTRQLKTLNNGAQIHDSLAEEHGIRLEDHDALIKDHSRCLSSLESGVQRYTSRIDEHDTRLDSLDSQYQNQQEQIVDIKEHITKDKKKTDKLSLGKLKQKLMKINDALTRAAQLSPLQERGDDGLPIELLFASMIVREENKYAEKDGSHVRSSEVTEPNDLFIVNGDFVEKIFMLGDAAHGKTIYCLWLLKKWCNALDRKTTNSNEQDKWETFMLNFDFVFLLQFRNVNRNLASVVDIICEDVFMNCEDCHSTIRYVLSSGKFRTLIIMDGLDEWNPNEDTRRQLKYKVIPNICVSSTVSCLVSMRPWIFALISKMVRISDIIIEIHGLSESGVEQAVENVLLNHYELKDDLQKYELTKEKIVKHLYENSLKSFMQIPLLAVVCVQILYEGKELGNSMTSFYTEMLSLLIERAYDKYEIQGGHDNTPDVKESDIFPEHENINNYFSVILKIGKVAYKGLLSNENSLVFQRRRLEKEIGLGELQFALDVGLISQKEARSLTRKNVRVHFFHKSIQEFLAAIYIVINKEVGDSFCSYLCDIKIIMAFSNVIMYICGICPSLGSVISQRVVMVTDSDTEICKYRESPSRQSLVRELYKLQVSWYKEFLYARKDFSFTFHISDVYLSKYSDKEMVRMTKKIFSDRHVVIRSLYLRDVSSDGECGISNIELNDFLCNAHANTMTLAMVRIDDTDTVWSVPQICVPSLKYLYLDHVRINTKNLGSNTYIPLLTHKASLCVLSIWNVTLCDKGLDLSGMTSLSVLDLYNVTLNERGLDLSDIISLRELNLDTVNLGDRGLDLANMASLRELRLSHVNLGTKGLDLSDVTSLRVLQLCGVTLGLDLPAITSLQVLRLSYVIFGDRGLDLSDMTLLHELYLSHVTLCETGLDLSDMVYLRKLFLLNLTLGEKGLVLYVDMAKIERVELMSVNMSVARWQNFIMTLRKIPHIINVKVRQTNIDDKALIMIRSSPDFNVIQDRIDELEFFRIWPLSQVKQDDGVRDNDK